MLLCTKAVMHSIITSCSCVMSMNLIVCHKQIGKRVDYLSELFDII